MRSPGNGYSCSTRTIAAGALRVARSFIASHATLPLQNTTRRTADGSVTNGSSRTSSNDPRVNSSTGERLSFMRSGAFGVKITSGLRISRRT